MVVKYDIVIEPKEAEKKMNNLTDIFLRFDHTKLLTCVFIDKTHLIP